MKKNVFVKSNDQCHACMSLGMTRKGRMKSNLLYQLFTIGAFLTSLPLLFTACINDDGTYDYNELPEISFENIPELTEVIAYVDHIKLSPRFVSSTEGEINPGDPNWTVQYRFGHKGMGSMGVDSVAMERIVWLDLTPTSGFDIDVPADFTTGMYTLWVTLTDNRNGSVTSKQYDVSVSSSTYEGWLVLCNEGTDEVARLDMISKLPGNKIEAIHDICKGLPVLHKGTCINAYAQQQNPGDAAHLFTMDGSYELDPETFEGDPDRTFITMNFAFPVEDIIIKEQNFSGTTYTWKNQYKICFGNTGNAYVHIESGGGSAYATAVNTLQEGTATAFRVAPYCGFSWVRPWNSAYNNYILFYDIDNKRFLMFDGKLEKQQMSVIPDPSGDDVNLFSYTTGKDFVYMQSTRRSNGLVYTILQDPTSGKRSIYGINLGGSGYAQELYIPEVNAPGFEQATTFAFDNRFPLLFYSVGSKLYCYNLGTAQTKEVPTQFSANEEITVIKFNLYMLSVYSTLSNQSEEFMNAQYRLIVGTCNNDLKSGGKVTFFDVDGVNNTATQAEQYTGFAKIADIQYRERQN